MRGDDQEVGAEVFNRKRHAAGGLHRVDDENAAMGANDLGDRGDRLDDARLVVDQHDGNHRQAELAIMRG
ncbi:hypothetical protein D3C71_2227590 [compost metagenome]